MLHASQPVPAAQWPELAARSFSWLWQNEKWLRMHQGDGLNVQNKYISNMVPNDSMCHTLNWFYLSVTFQDCKSAIQMFAANSIEKIRILMQTSGEKYWGHWTLQITLTFT